MQRATPIWILLVFVMLFSSCTIRKGVQAGLELPVNKQLNPSKATVFQQNGCLYSEETVAATTPFLNKNNTVFYKAIFFDFNLPAVNFLPEQKENVNAGWPLTLKIKQFILFRQLKALINI